MKVTLKAKIGVTGRFSSSLFFFKRLMADNLVPLNDIQIRMAGVKARIFGIWSRFFMQESCPKILAGCVCDDHELTVDVVFETDDLGVVPDFLFWVSQYRGRGWPFEGSVRIESHPDLPDDCTFPITAVYDRFGVHGKIRNEYLTAARSIDPEEFKRASNLPSSQEVLQRRLAVYTWVAEHPGSSPIDIARGLYIHTISFGLLRSDIRVLVNAGALILSHTSDLDIAVTGRYMRSRTKYRASGFKPEHVLELIAPKATKS